MKNKTKKTINIIFLVLSVLIVAGFIAAIILQNVLPQDNPFVVWFKDNVTAVKAPVPEKDANGNDLPIAWPYLPYIFQCLVYVAMILSACKILRSIFHLQLAKSGRVKTIITLLDALVKYGCGIAIFIFILKAFGVDTAALIASVGVLALIVGLGAQTLIADIIAGVFFVFENEFNVGETIVIDGFRGKVLEIGIRSTKLIDAAGNIKICNHSGITSIVNLSRELSLAIVDCDFPYDVPIEYIENLFEKHFEKIKDKIPAIVDGPYYKGVCMYKASNVTVRIVAQCDEEDRFQVERDLMREYRQILKENGIDISYERVILEKPTEVDIKVSKKNKMRANEIVEEQAELSEGMDEQQQ